MHRNGNEIGKREGGWIIENEGGKRIRETGNISGKNILNILKEMVKINM